MKKKNTAKAKPAASTARKTKAPSSKKKDKLPPVPEWKPFLSQYRNLQWVRFPHPDELDKALQLLWTEPFLDLPHDTPDGRSLVLPLESLPYFAQAGIQFTAQKLRTISDLTSEEI